MQFRITLRSRAKDKEIQPGNELKDRRVVFPTYQLVSTSE